MSTLDYTADYVDIKGYMIPPIKYQIHPSKCFLVIHVPPFPSVRKF
jgi:hypothetical protein